AVAPAFTGKYCCTSRLKVSKYAFKTSGFSLSSSALNPNLCRVLPFFSVTSPAASALRTHCVPPTWGYQVTLPVQFQQVNRGRVSPSAFPPANFKQVVIGEPKPQPNQ